MVVFVVVLFMMVLCDGVVVVIVIIAVSQAISDKGIEFAVNIIQVMAKKKTNSVNCMCK